MLTEKEKELLKHLRFNSRTSLSKINKETGIPISTLFETLKKLESGWITKHTSLLDFSKMGYNMKVHFVINSKEKQKMKEFLLKSSNVNSLSTLINEYDFYAECVFKDLKEMSDFKEKLEDHGINTIDEAFIVDEIKKEQFYP